MADLPMLRDGRSDPSQTAAGYEIAWGFLNRLFDRTSRTNMRLHTYGSAGIQR